MSSVHPSRVSEYHQIGIPAKKNITSKLQPADAGIIRNLKAKYRKRVGRLVTLLDGKNNA